MSFHNRLLLNRAVVSGLASLEVLVLVAEADRNIKISGPVAEISARVARLGGRVLRTEAAVGYLRAVVPTARLLELLDSPAIEAYQIASLSRGTWYRDGPPMRNAEMYRGYEVTPIAAVEPVVSRPDLPVLSGAESRARGFTADDAGVDQWLTEHPTFDGRGVTIALVENALPWFADPAFRDARTLDGRVVPKIAGILNVLGSEEADETRVRLDTVVTARKSWTRITNRTYVLPHPGTYRFGVLDLPAGTNVIHRFAVVEDQATREVWMDSNGDASFQDEAPLADINDRFEPRFLKLSHPRKVDVSFVMGRGDRSHVVHIYMGKGSHQSMTLSVAAGSRTDEGLAYGVAPGARVLLVRIASLDSALAKQFEGFIEAAQRPDVDVITSSTPLAALPDTAADFAGTFFRRLTTTYQKPIVVSAGNNSPLLGSTHALGAALSVGGILAPPTWAALYGGRALNELIVSPISAAGPSIDGAIKPDFLAPMERLAADLPWNTDIDAAPRSAPTRRIPPGYQVSCCTSATSPYAAGMAALLISGAKQSRLAYTGDSLNRAMKVSARLLSGAPAHQQGNGLLDINAAWVELNGRAHDPPRIIASTTIVHPLAQYAARGPVGTGILEFEGWTVGMKGTREITLRRESGPSQPVTYRLDWTASDGSFRTASLVTLPLRLPVVVPVHIDITSAGPHSGLLNLRDAVTNVLVYRTQATIVAAEPFDSPTRSIRVAGTVGLMSQRAHYVRVPPGVGALAFELDVRRGVVQPTIVPSHGLFPGYYMHVHPMNVFFVGKGRYEVRLPNPEPGTWTFQVATGSTWFAIPGSPVPAEDGDAEYTLTMRLLEGSIRTSTMPSGTIVADLTNTGSAIAEPVLEVSAGHLTSHRGSFLPTGLPKIIEINVPRDAATLSLQLRSEHDVTKAELYLYDCTTGECFSYNIGFPAARAHTLVVRKPTPGRWVAAVNPAPFPAASGAFVLDEVITSGTPLRRTSAAARGPGARWQETVDAVTIPPLAAGKAPILLFELLDAAAERGEVDHPWSTAPNYVQLRDRPVALGTVIYRR